MNHGDFSDDGTPTAASSIRSDIGPPRERERREIQRGQENPLSAEGGVNKLGLKHDRRDI